MSPGGAQQRDRLMDAYLDGLLDGAEWVAFERCLEQEGELRAEIDHQRLIDQALQRLFVLPPSGQVAEAVQRAVAAGSAHIRRGAWTARNRRLAVAAVLALGVASLWMNRTLLWPARVPHAYAPQPWRPLHAAYRFELERGFKPDWVCKTDREFATAFHRRLGQELLLAEPPEPGGEGKLDTVGLSSRNTITPRTLVLLAHAEGKEVLVFVDRADADSGQSVPPESGLRLYRRRIGDLVLYELSPLDRAYLLELFYIP